MDEEDLRVGLLVAGAAGPGETAARNWCRERFADVETASLAAVADGSVDLDRFDVCWWHAVEPVANPRTVAACEPRVTDYVESGGGLLLSARAMGQVAALGVDEVPPDATGTEAVHEPVGPLWKSAYADHPAHEGFETLRHHTRPAGEEAPFARYEDVLPAAGDVLASTHRGADDVPHEVTTVSWRRGAGTVVGVGVGLDFERADDHTRAKRDRLTGNLLRFLADGGADGTAGIGGETDPETAATALTTGRPHDAETLARHRAALAGDRHRTSYHLSPPANWLNDPNGCLYYDGQYHVFYQYNPGGPYHETIHWGHFVSDDLLTWRDVPVALAPDPGGPDRDGCWSGCAFVTDEAHAGWRTDAPAGDGSDVRVLYTGGREGWQLPCLGSAVDGDLSRFETDPANPVIDDPPAALDVLTTDHWNGEFRDHCVWVADGWWYQLVGAGLEDVGGAVVCYRSRDCREWEYLGPSLVGDWESPGTVWECPELLRFADGDLLHVSNYEDVVGFVGEWDEETGTFEREATEVLDPGEFYAPQSLEAPDGRTLMFGWIKEARTLRRQWDAGWSGLMSLPREVSVENGDVRQRPAREVRDLREATLFDGTVTVTDGRELLDAEGDALEIEATVDPDAADAVGVVVRLSPDGAESTQLKLVDGRLVLDRTGSSLDREVNDHPVSVPVDDLETPLDLRVFVDGSVVEAFVNGRRCLTGRIYPTRHDATGVGLLADGASEGVDVDLTVHAMGSIWPTELRGRDPGDPARTAPEADD
ncbi:hypothetical protein GCM10027435_17510 [Haloparvum alkalitolerans]|uniref:GH32 C-terminal domain-containing protein n=1 Tax=Haloparvum alkalitolerans TaxID=1042953 RepID=UPI003CFADDD6